MKVNEVLRQKINSDMQAYFASGGQVQQLAHDACAADWQPIKRKRREHIKITKRRDPLHPCHSD